MTDDEIDKAIKVIQSHLVTIELKTGDVPGCQPHVEAINAELSTMIKELVIYRAKADYSFDYDACEWKYCPECHGKAIRGNLEVRFESCPTCKGMGMVIERYKSFGE